MAMSFVFGISGVGMANGQEYKTYISVFECHVVTKREDYLRFGTKGEYGQVSSPIITCSKCKDVSNER